MTLIVVSLGLTGVFRVLHLMFAVVAYYFISMGFYPIPNQQTIDP